MQDDLLFQRADQAIRTSRLTVQKARENLLRARMVVARVKGNLRLARADVTRHPLWGTAYKLVADPENPEGKEA
jgi:hypothetical protein